MDGYCRLTSLLDPFADTIVNNRSRIAPQSIAWVDALQAAVSSEEGAWIKYYPLRRFYSSTMLARHGGIGGSVASSRMHTFVLSGGTEGEAIFSNPARRMFHAKIKNYQQTWFQLEFAQSTGMFRINEGFKLEMKEPLSAMVHSTVSSLSGGRGGRREGGIDWLNCEIDRFTQSNLLLLLCAGTPMTIVEDGLLRGLHVG